MKTVLDTSRAEIVISTWGARGSVALTKSASYSISSVSSFDQIISSLAPVTRENWSQTCLGEYSFQSVRCIYCAALPLSSEEFVDGTGHLHQVFRCLYDYFSSCRRCVHWHTRRSVYLQLSARLCNASRNLLCWY